jgi:hypothetical protein
VTALPLGLRPPSAIGTLAFDTSKAALDDTFESQRRIADRYPYIGVQDMAIECAALARRISAKP